MYIQLTPKPVLINLYIQLTPKPVLINQSININQSQFLSIQSLIGFGFTIFKFLEGLAREGAAIREHSPRNLGLFLIFLGIGMLILGMMQYKQSLKKLAGINEEKAPFSLAMIAAGAVILVGIFTLLNMLFGFGGF
jgi:uncharacterized membrane protein YidH (DUF202 family)